MEKQYTFHVEGMHCHSCVLVTESTLQEVTGVRRAKTNLASRTVEVTGDFGEKQAEDIARELSDVLKKHGYTLSRERSERKRAWGEFRYAIPLTLAFVITFVALQKAGLVNVLSGASGVTYGTAFAVGIIASLSTCMAVVGGLVLSLSATYAKEGSKVKPLAFFHGGRLVSFFSLGGALGVLGSTFQLSDSAMFVLSLVLGIVMLILGVNLLDVFDWSKKLQLSMPKVLSKRALGVSKFHHTFTPVLAGVATFFLPCGFTQSMQLYALTTGTFLTGGLTMLAFALGTLPVLGLISFSLLRVEKSANRGVFFKTAGLIVILFAVFNVMSALVAAGLIKPFFNL